MDEEMDELLRELAHIQDRLRFLEEDFEAAKTAEERMVILGRKLPLTWRLGEISGLWTVHWSTRPMKTPACR